MKRETLMVGDVLIKYSRHTNKIVSSYERVIVRVTKTKAAMGNGVEFRRKLSGGIAIRKNEPLGEPYYYVVK